MRTSLVQDALSVAASARQVDQGEVTILHADRGSHYTSGDFTRVLADHGTLASLGSTGDVYDSALAESFVDAFKTELIADRAGGSSSRSWNGPADPTTPACTAGSTTSHREARSAQRRVRAAELALDSATRGCNEFRRVGATSERVVGPDSDVPMCTAIPHV